MTNKEIAIVELSIFSWSSYRWICLVSPVQKVWIFKYHILGPLGMPGNTDMGAKDDWQSPVRAILDLKIFLWLFWHGT